MDSVFHPTTKRWIHSAYPFRKRISDELSGDGIRHHDSPGGPSQDIATEEPQQNPDEDIALDYLTGFPGAFGGFPGIPPSTCHSAANKFENMPTSSLLKFEPCFTTEVPDEDVISSLRLEMAEQKHEEKLGAVLADCDKAEDDQLSLASDSDLSDADLSKEDVRDDHAATSMNLAPIETAQASAPPKPFELEEIPAVAKLTPIVTFVIEKEKSIDESLNKAVCNSSKTGVKRSERLKRKQQEDVATETSRASTSVSLVPRSSEDNFESWEVDVMSSLELSKEEYSEFVKSQGLLEKSKDLPKWMDFGTLAAKGFPKSAVPIPKDVCAKSETLRIYQNVCRPNATAGSMIAGALDLGLYQPLTEFKTAEENCSDLLPSGTLIVTVDLYFPSSSNVQFRDHAVQKMKMPGLSSSITITSTQTLKDLCGILHCENDLIPTKAISSLKELEQLEKAEFLGQNPEDTCIVINNIAYLLSMTSDEQSGLQNALKQWKGQKLLNNRQPLQFQDMAKAKLQDTDFRPGYPYLYTHHGCEHLLVFTNVREIHQNDPKSSSSYPFITYFQTCPPIKCRVNSDHLAKVIVENDPRLPELLTPLCKECSAEFCFSRMRNREIARANMKIYPLMQMANLPIRNMEL